MPNMSVGGLVSGLDTATIIGQLMQLEARPQTMLKSKVSTEQKIVSALQALNTKLASIATKAAGLTKATAWTATKATSFSDKVLVTADPSMSPTSLTMTVNSLATSASTTYATQATASGTAIAANLDYQIKNVDGTVAGQFNTGDGTMQAVADAINATGGFKATLVKVGVDTSDPNNPTPVYQLQVNAVAIGEKSNFTIEQYDPANPTVPPPSPVPFMGGQSGGRVATDAEIVMNGATFRYATNTITDLVPGLDVTLTAGAEKASGAITVAQDVASLTESVKAMVDSVNAALNEIGTLTAYDAASKKAGLLGGDSLLRGVRNQLIESVSRGLGGESLATVGIEVDRYGKLTFDEAKFKSAYAADPAGTVAKFAGTDATATNEKDPYDTAYGFADRLNVMGEAFSNSIDGTITNAIKNRQSAIRGMEDDIAGWDVRLATRQATLQRQYTALETALGKLQSQSSWLAGQLASLPQMSSGQ
ncbi:MAG TPA: flagellar filament capping protein FliD [Nocardioidaceae bacterium]|nr:flagellar filament capping protein FliD [Nocardioidaceae bacterium]